MSSSLRKHRQHLIQVTKGQNKTFVNPSFGVNFSPELPNFIYKFVILFIILFLVMFCVCMYAHYFLDGLMCFFRQKMEKLGSAWGVAQLWVLCQIIWRNLRGSMFYYLMFNTFARTETWLSICEIKINILCTRNEYVAIHCGLSCGGKLLKQLKYL